MPKDFLCLTIQWFLSKMVYLEVGAIPLEHLAHLVLLLFWWRHRCWMEDPRPYFLLSLTHPQTPWWTQQWIQRVKTMEVTHPQTPWWIQLWAQKVKTTEVTHPQTPWWTQLWAQRVKATKVIHPQTPWWTQLWVQRVKTMEG